MAKSYRRPYTFISGIHSRQKDRTLASRAVRRKQDHYLHEVLLSGEYDDVLLPHRLECTNNDPWGWNSDGHARLVKRGPSRSTLTHLGIPPEERPSYRIEWTEEDDLAYFKRCSRK